MDKPFPAYKGDEPFVFICYAHADAAVVYPELAWIDSHGVKIWYDEGISAGENWRANIGKALLDASHVLVYLSRSSLQSDHCNREINLALDEGKTVLPIYLEPVELTPDLKVGLNRVQALQRDGSSGYRQSLLNALEQSSSIAITPPPTTRAPTMRRRWGVYGVVALLVAVLAGISGWYAMREAPLDDADLQTAESLRPRTVSLRPFSVIGDDADLARYAEVVTEDIRTMLGNTNARLVSSEGAQDTGSDYIVDGRVQRLPNGIRISVDLRGAEDGEIAWSKTMDEPAATLTEVEFERAAFVAGMIERVLTYVVWRALFELQGITDTYALNQFFAGMLEFQEIAFGAGGDWGLMVNHFERAIASDPEFAAPYAALSGMYGNRLGMTITAKEALPLAHHFVQQSLAMNPDATQFLAQINTTLDLDYASATANLDHALRAKTVSLGVFEWYKCSNDYAQGQFDAAIVHCKSAVAAGETDNPAGLLRRVGRAFYHAGRYQDAKLAFDEAVRLGRSGRSGDSPVLLLLKSAAAFRTGNTFAANEALDEALERFGDDRPGEFPGVLALLGRTAAAQAALEVSNKLHQAGMLPVYGPTFWGHFYLGDLDEAFVWLTRAIDNREIDLIGALRGSIILDDLRSDPRFAIAISHLKEIEGRGSPTSSVATM